MARETNAAITYNDAIYMVNNEGFTTSGTPTGSEECMTRSEIEGFFTNVDSTLFAGYDHNELVPYHLLSTTTNNEITFDLDVHQINGDWHVSWVTYNQHLVERFYLQHQMNGGVWADLTDMGGAYTGDYSVQSFIDANGGDDWCYRVRALDTSGNYSAWSYVSCIVGVANNPPSAPSNLTSQQQGTSIYLDWSPATDSDGTVTGYEIYRNDGGTNVFLLATIGTATDYTDTYNLTNGIQYTYSVKAKDNDGATGNLSNTSIITYTTQTTYTHSISFSSTASGACSDYNAGYRTTYYTNNQNFRGSTKIWTNSSATQNASAGYYSNGTDVISYSGTGATQTTVCGL